MGVVESTKVKLPYSMKREVKSLSSALDAGKRIMWSEFVRKEIKGSMKTEINREIHTNIKQLQQIGAEGNSCWIIDSGAAQHMTANRDLLVTNYCEFLEPEPVALGDSRYVVLSVVA